MASVLNPILYPEIWDKIFIGQVQSPGVCEVKGFSRAYKWDSKGGKGSQGATSTYVERPVSTGTVRFQLWEESHFDEWERFQALLEFDPTKKTVTAVDLYHPTPANNNINAVVTDDIGDLTHVGKGLYEITVTFREYAPPPKKNASGTPSGAKSTQGGTTPGAPPDPIADAQQKQIADLLAQAGQPSPRSGL